ncbi:G1/S-specific cyclin-D3 isoform X2 [Eleutherodactylus coqui]|uniref:G1/S-specific cyclin-D3 isoform X2 n=1 Tax=Eleutherodactylus coqui TaxID=57060 RepID=UPI0034634532
MRVCDLQLCDEGVFPLAMSYVRTCLSLFPVRFDQMRLLGATCLFLASKMKNESPLSLSILQRHTDYTVTSQQIKDWELFVVKQLRWDLAIIIPHDFLDYILEREFFSLDLRPVFRKNAVAYLTLCCANCNLCRFAPSTIAGVCIAKAISDSGYLVPPADDFYTHLLSLTEATTDEFLACKTAIENALCKEVQGDHTYFKSSYSNI